MDKDALYEELLAKAKEDPDVLGFILAGGRGKGMSTEHSDYDLLLIVRDGAKEAAEERYIKPYRATESVEGSVLTLGEFRDYGNWDTDENWQAYNFAHLRAQIDRTGEIQKLIEAKGRIPEESVEKFVSDNLGGFLNQHYRAFKNDRDGNAFAAYMDAVESVPRLLDVLFGREGRVRPYNKFLEWELTNHPLAHLPWPPADFLASVKKVLQTGDIETMKDFYRQIRDTSLQMGYEREIKDWEGYKME